MKRTIRTRLGRPSVLLNSRDLVKLFRNSQAWLGTMLGTYEHQRNTVVPRGYLEIDTNDSIWQQPSALIQADTYNMGFLFKALRKTSFGRSKDDVKLKLDGSPLRHRPLWTKRKLESEVFCVKGALGWITRKRIKFDFLADFYDLSAWGTPFICGMLTGIKRNAR